MHSIPSRQGGTLGSSPTKPYFGNLEHVMAFGQTHAPVTILVTVVTHRHQASSDGLMGPVR